MNRTAKKLAVLFSVSMNIAVLGAVGYHLYMGRLDTESCANRQKETFAELQLSLEQEREFNQLREVFHAYRREHEAQMMELRRALLEQLLSERPDKARIDELLSAMSDRQSDTQRTLIDHLLAEKAVLRQDQRAVFGRILEDHILGSRLHSSERHGSEHQPETR